jgi:hypothetical protein
VTAPFGIEIHGDLEGLAVEQELGGGKFKVIAPRPHPSFADYYLQHSATLGVVWVKGVSVPFEADSYGNNLRSALDRISGQLDVRYGSPRKVNLIAPDALWQDPRDWMMSILQNERSFFHVWEAGKGATLPDDLHTVFLGVLALSSSSGSVIVEYASTRMDAAEREADNDLSELL